MKRAIGALVLASLGLVIAAWLSIRPRPQRAEAERLAAQLSAQISQAAQRAQARGDVLVASRALSAALETDEATLRDLASHELALSRTEPGETIEVWRALGSATPVHLLTLPLQAEPATTLGAPGSQLGTAAGRLAVIRVAALPVSPRHPELKGFIRVTRTVETTSFAQGVAAFGGRARLALAGGDLDLMPANTPAIIGRTQTLALPLPGELGREAGLWVEVPAGLPWTWLAAGLGIPAALAGALWQWRRRRPSLGAIESEGQRYRLVRSLARGGMGEVWEALALGSNDFQRRVAIKKVFPQHQADERYARMFVDEARIASHLHHANIVAVLDFGVADGVPFQVMEYIDGIDVMRLAELSVEQGRPMPPELALHVCTQTAHALQHAHEAVGPDGAPLGIVHRDVSPDNILISWDGDVKLSDFGIALATNRLEKTGQGLTKGKLQYMAPEQATAGTVDTRADLFSLGCILHLLLVGESPLSGDAAFEALLSGQELTLDPALPPDVAPLLERALRRSRFDRYFTAGAMAEALGAALAARLNRDPRLALREWLAPFRASGSFSSPPINAG